MASVLVIDDDPQFGNMLSAALQRCGHGVQVAPNGTQGIEMAQAHSYDVVYLDLYLPDVHGLELMERLRHTPGRPEVIVMSGLAALEEAERAMEEGAWDYVDKSTPLRGLIIPLMRALKYRLERSPTEFRLLNRERVVGSSQKLLECLEKVASAARSDAAVLITGETGTGKEIFARTLHENSKRKTGSFVVVDCTALPENLVESILFGHEKGAYTGAERSRSGLIREADGGTLFLDEIGDLPFSMQGKFLRVLQEKRFRPVGSTREIAVDFRLVTATRRDLEEWIRAGRFREDLYHRIHSITIHLPPLRERTEDIRELALHFLHTFCRRSGLNPKGVSDDFLEALESYSWPGNVRELANTIDSALAEGLDSPTLFVKHLPSHIRKTVVRVPDTRDAEGEGPFSSSDCSRSSVLPFKEERAAVIAEFERRYLQRLMEVTDWNMKEAARLSGLSQSHLYALVRKYKRTEI